MMNRHRPAQIQVAMTGFLALFSIVGLALYGLPLYYDHMVREFGWSRSQVTSGNALSKLLVGPLFGFIAGWAAYTIREQRTLVYLIAFGVLMAAFGRLLSISKVGLPEPHAVWIGYLVPELVFPFVIALSHWLTHRQGQRT